MIALLDVNVLIALAWRGHTHHFFVWKWFEEQREQGWATCLLTEAGFVRVSCNPAAVGRAATPSQAIELLRRLKQLGKHSFWPMDTPISELLPESVTGRLQGYRQVTDAVLLASAMRCNGQLATLDEALPRLVSEDARRHVHVVHEQGAG